MRSAPSPTARPPTRSSQRRPLAAALPAKPHDGREEIRKNHAGRSEQIREKYKNQRQRVKEKYANQRQQVREKYENQRQQVREVHEDRPEQIHEVPEDQRERIREAHEDRREEIRDEHWDHWRQHEDLGTVYTEWDFSDEDCEASIVVDGVTYYGCDGVWYRRAYSGGTVTYVVVEGPRNN
jgi:gas vesicle protein